MYVLVFENERGASKTGKANHLKKGLLAWILFLLCFVLFGCSGHAETYMVDSGEEKYTVDSKEHTITVQDYVYSYTIKENTLKIIYPNGATFLRVFGEEDYTSYGDEWSDDYAPKPFEKGEVLAEVLEQELDSELEKAPVKFGFWMWVMVLVLFVIGVWSLFFPYSFWKITNLLNVRGGEPTDLSLLIIQIIGVIDFIMVGLALYAVFR